MWAIEEMWEKEFLPLTCPETLGHTCVSLLSLQRVTITLGNCHFLSLLPLLSHFFFFSILFSSISLVYPSPPRGPFGCCLASMGRRQWHPTPVLLPGKSHGRRSLVGCSPWGHEESDAYWATSLPLFTFMHWRRKWQPTPVFLPGESQGQRSLVGCRLWGRTELDTTAAT